MIRGDDGGHQHVVSESYSGNDIKTIVLSDSYLNSLNSCDSSRIYQYSKSVQQIRFIP